MNALNKRRFRRRYRAADYDFRCGYSIVLKDGSGAQCMRPQVGGNISFCWQHARKLGIEVTKP